MPCVTCNHTRSSRISTRAWEWRACFQDLRQPANSSEAAAEALVASQDNLVDCSKVEVRPDGHGGAGVFAAVPIQRGELVERGIVRRLPVDGNVSPFVFTWSEDKSVWASGSGCSVFYNASLSGSENTEVVRHFDKDRFEIYALRDIEKGEELTHLYKSIEWRGCFRDLKTQRELSGLKKQDKERADFTEYWASDHSAATLENMMLDSDAAFIDKLERPEILSHMPSLQGKSVLELGAGIGRFSGILAGKAERVVAVDFVHSSCEENKRANADKLNLEVLQADVTSLTMAPGSFDLVFSNWLFYVPHRRGMPGVGQEYLDLAPPRWSHLLARVLLPCLWKHGAALQPDKVPNTGAVLTVFQRCQHRWHALPALWDQLCGKLCPAQGQHAPVLVPMAEGGRAV